MLRFQQFIGSRGLHGVAQEGAFCLVQSSEDKRGVPVDAEPACSHHRRGRPGLSRLSHQNYLGALSLQLPNNSKSNDY